MPGSAAPVYPDDWIADPCCQFSLAWIDGWLDGSSNKMTLHQLYNAPFKSIVESLRAYVYSAPRYIQRGNTANPVGRREDVLAALDRFLDGRINPTPTALPYKEIMWTESSRVPGDVADVSARCRNNGIYLPHNHAREMDKPEIRDFFLGEGLYRDPTSAPPEKPFLDEPLLQATPAIQIGEVTFETLFKTKRTDLTRRARYYLSEAKRLGIIRSHPAHRLYVNPTSAPGTMSGIGYGVGPNGKCCAPDQSSNPPVTRCYTGLPGQYCGLVDPNNPDSGCNAQSDPCV